MNDIAQLRVDFQNEVFRILGSVAEQLHEKIVTDTPIDTGRAKSSWNLSEDEPDFSTTPPLRETDGRGRETDNSLSPAQALIAAKGSAQNLSGKSPVIYIANGLDYIEGLEEGNSKQAPAGMVQKNITADRMELMIDRAIQEKYPF